MPWIVFLSATAAVCHAQPQPNLGAQREAMKKLEFLVGKWSGEATGVKGRGATFKVLQSEDVQYKLDGLVMLLEGTGRDPGSGDVSFRALATVSYDDAASQYRIRAYSDGRYLDTELKVVDRGFEWGFQVNPVTVKFSMRLNEKGEWVETSETTFPGAPPRKTLEMTVRKQK